MTKPKHTFRSLTIQQSFDFVDSANHSRVSFWDRCMKTGPRTYTSIRTGVRYTVGTINCEVFNTGLPLPGGYGRE